MWIIPLKQRFPMFQDVVAQKMATKSGIMESLDDRPGRKILSSLTSEVRQGSNNSENQNLFLKNSVDVYSKPRLS